LAKQALSNQQVVMSVEQAADNVDDYPGDDLFNDDEIDDISNNISDHSYDL
jgi:hypothetical protein